MTEIAIPGQVLAQKYRLMRRLGQGGMGVVWEAEHLVLGSRVAIKLLDPSVSQHVDITERFLREARAAATLQCDHVVRVFDHDTSEGHPFIVMEKLEGETLAERLDREGPLTPRQTFSIVEQICVALTRAHQVGIVHRDIKPSNVFLTLGEGQREVVKVLDFGIAKHLTDTRGTDPPTACGVVMGTPWYMSPEQAQGERAIDYSTDLWATGVLTFECLTGQRPFEHDSFRDLVRAICQEPHPAAQVQADYSRAFNEWFQRATARDRARRFRNAQELLTELQVALALPPPAKRSATPRRSFRSKRPTRTLRSANSTKTQRSPSTSLISSSAIDVDGSTKRDSRKTLTITALIGLVSCALSISLRPRQESTDTQARVEATAAPTTPVAAAMMPADITLSQTELTQWVPLAEPSVTVVGSSKPVPDAPTPRVTPASFELEPPPAAASSSMERAVHSPQSASVTAAPKTKQKVTKPVAAKKQVVDLGI